MGPVFGTSQKFMTEEKVGGERLRWYFYRELNQGDRGKTGYRERVPLGQRTNLTTVSETLVRRGDGGDRRVSMSRLEW